VKRSRKIKSIPISAVTVPNPRDRRQAPFKELVTSIARVGLKRPITVSDHNGSGKYELVCGEGRIEAFTALKAKEIPAIVTDVSAVDCILLSLVENIARRRHSPVELVGDINRLAKQYDANEIAAKLGALPDYVKAVCQLLKNGEEQLIKALERKAITPTLALEIARADTPALQRALLQLYADGSHTIEQIAKIRKLMGDRRRRQAKSPEQDVTPADLVRVYRQETARHELVARKADLTHMRLMFIVSALKTLLSQRMFVKLLREEALDKIPLPLLRHISALPEGVT
jgi:ParB family transcriptional regulator, chromosome partitioning protein